MSFYEKLREYCGALHLLSGFSNVFLQIFCSSAALLHLKYTGPRPNMPHNILSFRALARNRVPIYRYELTAGNLIINYFEIVIDNRYS